jgi:hypothetical protein
VFNVPCCWFAIVSASHKRKKATAGRYGIPRNFGDPPLRAGVAFERVVLCDVSYELVKPAVRAAREK